MSITTLHPTPLSAWERAVRADALLILVRAKLMHQGSAEAAMAALGITRGDMSAARARTPEARMAAGPAPRPEPGRSEQWAGLQPRPAGRGPDPDRHARRGNASPGYTYSEDLNGRGRPPTTARPVSTEGDLRCSRCGQWKPAEDFRLRSDRIGSGTRRSACDPCHARANRARYVSLKVKAELNAIGVTLSLEDGDAVGGLACLACGEPLVAGDDVESAADLHLRHVRCPS